MEQDRAPAVLPHHHELARQAADQPRGHRERHRRHHHQHRANASAPNWTPGPTRPESRSATSRWPPFPSPPRLARRLELHPAPPATRPATTATAPRPRGPERPGWAHPALTGLTATEWDQLIRTLALPYQAQRDTSLYIRRGGPPTRQPAGGHPPRSASPRKPWSPSCGSASGHPGPSSPNCSASSPAPSPPPNVRSSPCSTRPATTSSPPDPSSPPWPTSPHTPSPTASTSPPRPNQRVNNRQALYHG